MTDPASGSSDRHAQLSPASEPGALKRVVQGEDEGTLVHV